RNAVANRVLSARQQRLRVQIDAERRARAQLQCRDRENAGSAAVVDYRFLMQIERIQRLQAKGRRRVRPGPEGESRIEPNHDGLGILWGLGGRRAYPQAAPESHRLPV